MVLPSFSLARLGLPCSAGLRTSVKSGRHGGHDARVCPCKESVGRVWPPWRPERVGRRLRWASTRRRRTVCAHGGRAAAAKTTSMCGPPAYKGVNCLQAAMAAIQVAMYNTVKSHAGQNGLRPLAAMAAIRLKRTPPDEAGLPWLKRPSFPKRWVPAVAGSVPVSTRRLSRAMSALVCPDWS